MGANEAKGLIHKMGDNTAIKTVLLIHQTCTAISGGGGGAGKHDLIVDSINIKGTL